MFNDDPTINIAATYRDRRDDVRFICYCSKKNPELFGQAVFGITLDELEKGTNNHWKGYQSSYDCDDSIKRMQDITRWVCDSFQEEPKPGHLPNRLYEQCVSSCAMIKILEAYSGKSTKWYQHSEADFSKEEELYKKLFDKLAARGNIFTRWPSEYSLYMTIRDDYPDAKYQYRAEWLGRQSLDVFIPSLNMGVEYQGIQHYEPVAIFGGEEGFTNTQERDAREKKACQENGVLLMEWKYSEIISLLTFREKLNEMGISPLSPR